MTEVLAKFLRARIAEDEQTARAASPGPWKPNAEHDEVWAVDDIAVADGFALSNRQLRATVDHIARHDPARVLAECEARRRIVELHSGNRYSVCETCSDPEPLAAGDSGGADWPCQTLRLLALPYADHPDYRDEWRP